MFLFLTLSYNLLGVWRSFDLSYWITWHTKVFLVVLICFFGYLVKCHQPPSDPVWPELFQQSFQEKFYYPVVGTHYTNGTYYYDYTNRRYRVNRDNGRYDRYCGFNGVRFFQDTPCTQLVINGVRWMIYPEKQECCE